jgi:hypothetical protein
VLKTMRDGAEVDEPHKDQDQEPGCAEADGRAHRRGADAAGGRGCD